MWDPKGLKSLKNIRMKSRYTAWHSLEILQNLKDRRWLLKWLQRQWSPRSLGPPDFPNFTNFSLIFSNLKERACQINSRTLRLNLSKIKKGMP